MTQEIIEDINALLLEEHATVQYFTFEWALTMLKGGHRIRRRTWPSTRFIYKVDGSQFAVSRPPLDVIFPAGTIINYLPHIDVCENSKDAICRTYEVTTADLFATDWEISNEPTN